MQLSDNQAEACQALLDELRDDSTHQPTDRRWLASSIDEDWQDYLESCTELSETSDEEMFEDSGDDEVPSRQGLSLVSWDFVASTPLQIRILELLIALYTHLPIGGDNKFYTPILRFVTLLSRKKNGQWVSPRRITQFLAILLFCGRLVMMALMHRAVLVDPEIRYSRCVMSILATAWIADAVEQGLRQHCVFHERWP
jgi:hypothetical protein